MEKPIIERELILDMLFGEEKYINEFSRAAIESFEEFLNDYSRYLQERDMENLRRAGHKIKPVAQMLHVDELVTEYEQAKSMLNEKRPDEDLQKSVGRVQSLCNRIIKDFKHILGTNL